MHGQQGKAGEISSLTIHLDDPEANRFARLFKSGWWIVSMQLLMPIGLLAICANASAQIIIERYLSMNIRTYEYT